MNLAANQFLEQLVPVFQSVFFPCRQQDLWSGFEQIELQRCFQNHFAEPWWTSYA